MSEEEIFIKDTKPKKKRQLTEKQLEGLKKGREKMAEKRKLKKEMDNKRKELAALDKKATVESKNENKKTREIKKKVIEEQTFIQKKQKADKSSTKFNKLRTDAVKHLKNSQEMNEFEKIMSGVSKDMERDPEQLYKYLREHGDRLIGTTKEKLRPIKEEPEEIKPSIKLSIDEL